MVLIGCLQDSMAQTEDLSVLSLWVEWSDAANMLQHHLNSQAFDLLERRLGSIRALKTAESWKARQAAVRATLDRVVGPFPERTPLNARILGTIAKEGYTIEKVVFDSVPNFHVTGCLFLPNQRRGKAPAILNVIGHTDISFRAPSYQRLILNLVKKGFIVFAIDPIGQGERLQYYDPAQRRSLVGGATTEHSYFGRQCFIAGSSAARYFTWDGIRAIDYLAARPEVDASRIGVTGISGGGTQTSYIAAMDDRVVAAAPANYIAGFRRLLESIGPQDAEQNFNAGILHGIDHADFLEVRAPRPTLVVATTRDFFSIQGTRETFAEAREAFRLLGSPDNLSMVEDDFGHGYTRKTREAIYRFFQRYLNHPGDPADEEVATLPEAELTVTPTGQVSDSLGGETVFSLNRSLAEKLAARLEASRQNLPSHLERVRTEARRISGYPSGDSLSSIVYRGRYARDGYSLDMFVLQGEGNCLVPVLYMTPDLQGRRPALIYLHPQGKSAAAGPGGEAEQLVKRGVAVLMPDLAGTGESGRAGDAVAFLAGQIGRSIAGVRAGEIAQCVRFLRGRDEIDGERIGAIARGELAIPLLHAAAFDQSIKKIALLEPLVSFQSVVENRYYTLDPAALVCNALTAYDLPDLAASLAPRALLVAGPIDQLQKPATSEVIVKSFEVVRRSYAAQAASEYFTLRTTTPGQSLTDILGAWLR
jgi:cephalosporin-C deacetylase-like acetyl esterase